MQVNRLATSRRNKIFLQTVAIYSEFSAFMCVSFAPLVPFKLECKGNCTRSGLQLRLKTE